MDSSPDFHRQKKLTASRFIPIFLSIILLTGCASQNQSFSTDILRVSTEAIVQTDPAFISSDSEVMVANAV